MVGRAEGRGSIVLADHHPRTGRNGGGGGLKGRESPRNLSLPASPATAEG